MRQELKAANRPITISLGCPYAINTGLFEGFKTKLNLVFPMLEENYVSDRLVREFMRKKEICFIWNSNAFVMRLLRLLPSSISDLLLQFMDISNYPNKAA
jgi:all-trans-retinol dehydrogenase (NAD+)